MQTYYIVWELTIEYKSSSKKKVPSDRFIQKAREKLHEDIDRAEVTWLEAGQAPRVKKQPQRRMKG